jgi:hypothetical protein
LAPQPESDSKKNLQNRREALEAEEVKEQEKQE